MDLEQCDLFKVGSPRGGNDGAELRIQVLQELFDIHEMLHLTQLLY